MDWRVCETCGHLFTADHFDVHAARSEADLPAWGPDSSRTSSTVVRGQAGRIVHRVCELRGSISGVWMDAVLGDGALLAVAHEFGYEVLGLDPRETAVQRMTSLGYPARRQALEELPGDPQFDVISMVACLERAPFPAQTLQQAARLLRPDGVLFLSLPNTDSALWRELDARAENPWWSCPENFHNFSREHLFWLLRRCGFEPCDYAVSELTPVGMDVCAVLAEV
jgi:SAM-dependent methyltransferase